MSAEIRKLSEIQSGRSELRIILEFTFIALAMIAHLRGIIPFWTIPFVIIFIGSRQHALLVLMHESAHRRISRFRILNDLVGELIAWNFLASMRGYRRHHMQHHVLENINTMKDPDFARKQNSQWVFPMTLKDFLILITRDFCLLNTKDYLQEMKDAKNNVVLNAADLRWQLLRLFYSAGLIGVLVYTGGLGIWLLYWVLPMLTALKVIFRIRSICDHFCTVGKHPLSQTRTIIGNWFDRFLIAPCSIGVHGPHHVYPTVPYYNLRKAHNVMMQNVEYRLNAHVSRSYVQALGECLHRGGGNESQKN